MVIPRTEILITVDGAERGRFLFAPGEYIIGRNPECQICLEADLVSRRHAKLTLTFDDAFIEDFGSSNGTQVEGKNVTGSARLLPNQKIQVGGATIEMRRMEAGTSRDVKRAPAQEVVKQMLPQEFLREKKYDIGGVVARGGMGAIFDAQEAAIQRKVAVKVMLDGNDLDDLTRFIAEAQITGQLEHPNIVPVHELSLDENGQPYYTMKFVQGTTLEEVLDLIAQGDEATARKYPFAVLLTAFQKVCDGMAFAHSKGVIHRDLKPGNIMLGDFGEVLVMDWGLARFFGANRAATNVAPSENLRSNVHTAPADAKTGSTKIPSTIMGTPHFMSPEQARGEVDSLDARSDIYSLGGILYEILTLRPPVEGCDLHEVLEKVRKGEVAVFDQGAWARGRRFPKPTPGSHRSSLPDSLAAVVKKAMAFDKAARHARVEDLQADVLACQNGSAPGAENLDAWKLFTPFIRRAKAAPLGVAAVLLVGGVFGGKAIIEASRAEREAVRAVRGETVDRSARADLRRTARAFHALANVDFHEGRTAEALEKIGCAIELDESNAEYHLFRARLRQSSQDLAAAADGYRRVLALRPADAAAKVSLALCEQLLAENSSAGLNRGQKK